jgi:tape measure domain-containing protein
MSSDIQFKISSDSRQAQNDLRKLANSVNKIEDTTVTAQKGLVRLGQGIIAAFSTFAVGASIKQTADAFTQLNSRLSLSVGNMQDVIKAQKELFDVSQRTRTTVESTASVFSALARSLRKPREEIVKITETIQQAGIISGGSAESLRAALVQFNQGLQSGTLRGEELNSVLEQAPRLARAIADGMDTSIGKLRGLAEQGLITTDVIYDALQSQADVIQKEFDKVTITITQSLIKISNVVSLTLGEIFTETGLSSSVAGFLSRFADRLGDSRELIVTEVSLMVINIQQNINTATRFFGAFIPLFKQIGVEIKRIVPVVSFLQLQLGQKLNILFLKEVTTQAIIAQSALVDMGAYIRRVIQFFGVDFRTEFFQQLKEVGTSKSIPELEKNIRSLTKVLAEPTSLLDAITKSLLGDTPLFTALADYFNAREISKTILTVKSFLASIGLIENRLIRVGNIRFDKFRSFSVYLEEISRFIDRLSVVIFQKIVIGVQVLTQTIGSYFIEASRAVGGGIGRILRQIGKFIFELTGFSSVFESIFVTVSNTIITLGVGTFSLFLASFTQRSRVIADVILNPFEKAFSLILQGATKVVAISQSIWSKFYRPNMLDPKSIFDNIRKSLKKLPFAFREAFKDIVGDTYRRLQIPKAAELFENTFDRIRSAATRLNESLSVVLSFGKRVKDEFYDIWKKVVGNSYWPDTIKGIIAWAGLLPTLGLEKIREFSTSVKKEFLNLSKENFSLKESLVLQIKELANIDVSRVASQIGTAIITVIALAIYSPAALGVLGSAILFAIGKTAILGTESFFNTLFDKSLIRGIGYNIGTALGKALLFTLKSIPDIVGALSNYVSGVVEGLISQIPIVGKLVAGILSTLSGGNFAVWPLLLWPDFFMKKISNVIQGLGVVFGILEKEDPNKKPASDPKVSKAKADSFSDKLVQSVFGNRVNASYVKKAALVLLTSLNSQISLFQASLAAAPLMLVAILGEDVTGKIIRDTVTKVFTKVVASLATIRTSSGVLSSIFNGIFGKDKVGDVVKTGASVVGSIAAGLNRVLDKSRKEQFLAGGLSLKEFIFGSKKVDTSFSKSDFSSGASGTKGMLAIVSNTIGNPEDIKKRFPGSSILDFFLNGNNSDSIISKFVRLYNTAMLATVRITRSTFNTIRNFSIGDRFGVVGRFLFGKGGAVLAIAAALAFVSSSAEASTGSIISSMALPAIESGLLGALILGNDWTRGKLLDAIKAVTVFITTKVPGISGVLKTISSFSFAKLISGLSLVGLGIAGFAVATVGAIYYLGEGETVLARFSDGLRQTSNAVIKAFTGIENAIPGAVREFSQFGRLSSEVDKVAKSLDIVDTNLSNMFRRDSGDISLNYLNKNQTKELESILKTLTDQTKTARLEQEELGEASKGTAGAIEKALKTYGRFTARVSRKQAVDLSIDASQLSVQFEGIKERVSKNLAMFVIEGLQLAHTLVRRPAAVILDAIYNTIAAGINWTFDTNIVADPFIRMFEKGGHVLKGDQTASLFKDWNDRLTRRVDTDVSQFKDRVDAAGALIVFALREFQDLGEGDLLGRESGRIKSSYIRVSQEITAARAALASLDKKPFVLLSASERKALQEQKDTAVKNLEDLVREYEGLADQAASLKQSAIDVIVFQKSVSDLGESLGKLKIDFDDTELFGAKDQDLIKQTIEQLEVYRKALKDARDDFESRGIIRNIKQLELDVKLKLDTNTAVTLKDEAERALKNANITGFDWKDLLLLDRGAYQQIMNDLKNIAEASNRLNTKDLNTDLNAAAEAQRKLQLETIKVTRRLSEAREQSQGLANTIINASFGDVENFAKFYGLTVRSQIQLKSINDQMKVLSDRSQVLESFTIPSVDIDAEKNRLARQFKRLAAERDAILNPAKPEKSAKLDTPKTALENLGDLISKSNVKSSLDDVIFAALPLTEVIAQLDGILDLNRKLDALPKNQRGLPTDLNQAQLLKTKLDLAVTKFDSLVSSDQSVAKSLNDTITEIFKFSPDLLDRPLGQMSKAVGDEIKDISKQIEALLAEEFDPSKPLIESLSKFSQNKAKIKELTDKAGALLGTSLRSSFSALGISAIDLLTYDSTVRSKALSLSDKILKNERELEVLRNKQNTRDNISELARLEREREDLEKQKTDLLTKDTLGRQGQILSLDLTAILGYDEATRRQMVADKERLNEIERQLNETDIQSIAISQELVAERQKLLDKEREINEERSNQQQLTNTFLGQSKTLISSLLKGDGDAGKTFLDSFTGTIVDNFSGQLNDFLFKDLFTGLGSVFGENPFGKLGSSPTTAMWVQLANELPFGKGDSSVKTLGSSLSGITDKFKGIGSSISTGFNFLSQNFSAVSTGISSFFSTAFGSLFGFADGGFIPGHGSGATPIVAHAGELILNEAQQARVAASLMAAQSPNQININITGDISRQTKSEIYKMLPTISEGVNAHNREKGIRGR